MDGAGERAVRSYLQYRAGNQAEEKAEEVRHPEFLIWDAVLRNEFGILTCLEDHGDLEKMEGGEFRDILFDEEESFLTGTGHRFIIHTDEEGKWLLTIGKWNLIVRLEWIT